MEERERETQTRTDAESDPPGGFDVQLEGDVSLNSIDSPPEIRYTLFQRRGIGVANEWFERTGQANSVVDGEHAHCQKERLQSHYLHSAAEDRLSADPLSQDKLRIYIHRSASVHIYTRNLAQLFIIDFVFVFVEWCPIAECRSEAADVFGIVCSGIFDGSRVHVDRRRRNRESLKNPACADALIGDVTDPFLRSRLYHQKEIICRSILRSLKCLLTQE